MRLLPITTLFVLLAPVSFATVTVTVIENPSQTATLTPHTAKSTHISHVATSHQTKATVVPSSSTSAYTTPTSVIQATHIQSGYPSAAASHGVDVAGAAGGSDSDSFSLSKGGLIAIVVVVVVVAVFGGNYSLCVEHRGQDLTHYSCFRDSLCPSKAPAVECESIHQTRITTLDRTERYCTSLRPTKAVRRHSWLDEA